MGARFAVPHRVLTNGATLQKLSGNTKRVALFISSGGGDLQVSLGGDAQNLPDYQVSVGQAPLYLDISQVGDRVKGEIFFFSGGAFGFAVSEILEG